MDLYLRRKKEMQSFLRKDAAFGLEITSYKVLSFEGRRNSRVNWREDERTTTDNRLQEQKQVSPTGIV